MSLVSGPGLGGDGASEKLSIEKHIQYIVSLDKRTDEYEYWLTEHLRLNGVYWGLTALHILGKPDALPVNKLIDFTLSCWHVESGGFGAAPGHDPHMLYTCSAVQILTMVEALHLLDEPINGQSNQTKRQRIGKFISSLQDKSSGTFHGDQYGEPDTRFLYNAFNALSLLGLMDMVDVPLAIKYIDSCSNLDGGYGTVPSAESHSGQIFVCIGALAIAGVLDSRLEENPQWADRLGAWLADRQIASGQGQGGLNGRPEKKEDVCYSWWVISPLTLLKRTHWIDRLALSRFILGCQDSDNGGFSDRPGDAVDVFHTCFALAGLSLLEWSDKGGDGSKVEYGLKEIDPLYCMPKELIQTLSKQLGSMPCQKAP